SPVFIPNEANAQARLTATVDFPTPPFALATAMIRFTRPTPPAAVTGAAASAVNTAITLSTPSAARAAASARSRTGTSSSATPAGASIVNETLPSLRASSPVTRPEVNKPLPLIGSFIASRRALTRSSSAANWLFMLDPLAQWPHIGAHGSAASSHHAAKNVARANHQKGGRSMPWNDQSGGPPRKIG